MFRTRVASALLLLAVFSSSGCAHRLSGPIYSASGAPFVAGSIEPWAVSSDTSPISDAPDAADDQRALFGADFDVRHRMILIGDAGYYLKDDPTLALLDAWATGGPPSHVVFLGDNVYNEGMTDKKREHGEQILGQQLAATTAPKIVIPGNHDWGLLPKNFNAKSIANQQSFVDGWPAGNAEFIPKEGCMGPTRRRLREADEDHAAIVFIAIDPTPWINERIRAACPATPERAQEIYLERLDALLADHRDDVVIVVSHYPMLTGGPHGGLTYGFLADMIVTPLGWMMGGLMNTYEDGYADWITQTQAVFRRNPPAVYAAGHDHSLQLLEAGDVAGIYVVSGAGARDRVSTVTNLPETFFAHAAPGFVVLDFGTREDAETVVFRIIETTSDEPVFEMEMP